MSTAEKREPLWKRAVTGAVVLVVVLFMGWSMLGSCDGELRALKHLFGIEDSELAESEIAFEGLPETLNNDIRVTWHQHWLRDGDGRFRFVGKGSSGSATLYYGARVTVRNGRYDRNDWSFISKADYDRHLATPRSSAPEYSKD